MTYENEEKEEHFYDAFTTSYVDSYSAMVASHTQALRNFARVGHFLDNAALAAATKLMPMGKREIHSTDSTMVMLGNKLHYTSLVCYSTEPVAEAQ